MSLLWLLMALWFTLTGLIGVFGVHFDHQDLIMGILALVIGILLFWSQLVKKSISVP